MALFTTTPARSITPIITMISTGCPVNKSPHTIPTNASGIDPMIITGSTKFSNCAASNAYIKNIEIPNANPS